MTRDVTLAEAAAALEDAKACEAVLRERGVQFRVGEPISEGRCGVLRPVRIEALSSGITVAPDTMLLCRAALALDEWITADVVAATEARFPGTELSRIQTAATYVCRSRVGGLKISEHARGSAIDIAGFVLADGTVIPVRKQAAGSPEALFQREIRDAACGPFKTVLGPGSDAAHATHFHFDMAMRRNGSTYCK